MEIYEYPDNYELDEENEVAKLGFFVNLMGKDLFKERNLKYRCFRSIKRHFTSKGFDVYSLNCLDSNLLMMVGNCTLCELKLALRTFVSGHILFLEGTFASAREHLARIVFIKSQASFKRLFFRATASCGMGLSDCLISNWNSMRYYLTGSWEYSDLICNDAVYQAFNYYDNPTEFAVALFNPSALDPQTCLDHFEVTHLTNFKSSDKETMHFVINKALSKTYNMPIDFLVLFPTIKDWLIAEALKDNLITGYIMFNLVMNGFSFRKSAEELGCSHSKLYNAYTLYIKNFRQFEDNK